MVEALEMFIIASVLLAGVGALAYFLVKSVGTDDEQD